MTSLNHQVKQPNMGEHCQLKPKQNLFYRHIWRYVVSSIGSLFIVLGCRLRSSAGNPAPLHALVDACRPLVAASAKKDSKNIS